MPRPQHKHRHSHEIKHHSRNVHHVVRPIAPAGKKSMKIAEDFLGPQINPALARVTMRQFQNSDPLRPKEENQRNQPKPKSYAAIRSNARHHIQIEDRHNKQRNKIPAPQSPLQMRSARLPSVVRQCDSLLPATAAILATASFRAKRGNPLDFSHHYRAAATDRSLCAAATAGATSANTSKCFSISASVCATEIVHCSSHQ